MKRSKWIERSLVAAAIFCLLPLAGAGADDADKSVQPVQPEPLFSFPSDKRNLSFPDVGLLKLVLVKPGDVVKAGQLLATEDMDMEEIQYNSMKIEAESTADVEASIADRDSKKLVYDRLRQAEQSGGTNPNELEEAKLALQVAEIKIRYSREQHEEKLADLAKQAAKIERMKLRSPVDGIVEKISVFPGEVVDPVKPDGVLTIVTNKPLWADMHLQTAEAAKLKMGDAIQVAYATRDGDQKWFDAKVIYFDPVADAASDKQTIRLQLDNAEDRPAGLWLNVRMPSTPPNP